MSEINGLIGRTVLGYDVIELIGQGGFGKVYKAVKTTGKDKYYAAIKHIVLPNESNYNDILNSMGGNYDAADNYFESMLDDMIAEIKTLFSLSKSNNQNIVTYYDHDIVKHTNPLKYEIFIRMEYLTPLTLHLNKNDITLEDVLKLGIDISSSLEYCHSQGIIHRDVKDDNIFINEDGNYKLGDFGISKVLMDTKQALSVKGTPVYMAPEVILGKKYDKTVDIYSLGILLYKLLNYNRIPFLPKYPLQFTSRDTETAIEKRLSGEKLEPPIHSSYGLSEVILKACSSQENRYTGAKQLSDDLAEILNSMPKDELSRILYKKAERSSDTNPTQNTSSNENMEKTVGAGAANQSNVNADAGNYKGKNLFDTEKSNSYKENKVEANKYDQKAMHRKTVGKFILGFMGAIIIILILGIVLVKSILGSKPNNAVNKTSTQAVTQSGNNSGANSSSSNQNNTNGSAAQTNSGNAAAAGTNTSNATQNKSIDISKCSQTIFEGKTAVTLTSVELKGNELTIKGEIDNQFKDNVSGHVTKFYLKYKDNNVNQLDFFTNPSFNINAPAGAKTKFQMVYKDVNTSSDSVTLCGEFFALSYFGADNKIQIDVPLK